MEPQAPVCAHCGSASVTRVALFGSQLMTSQYRCEQCRTYFEHIRWDENETMEDPQMGPDAKEPAKG